MSLKILWTWMDVFTFFFAYFSYSSSKSNSMCALWHLLVSLNLTHWSFLLLFILLKTNSSWSYQISQCGPKPNPVLVVPGRCGRCEEIKNKEMWHVKVTVWPVYVINLISSFLFQNKPERALAAEAEVSVALDPDSSFCEPRACSGVLGIWF